MSIKVIGGHRNNQEHFPHPWFFHPFDNSNHFLSAFCPNYTKFWVKRYIFSQTVRDRSCTVPLLTVNISFNRGNTRYGINKIFFQKPFLSTGKRSQVLLHENLMPYCYGNRNSGDKHITFKKKMWFLGILELHSWQ